MACAAATGGDARRAARLFGAGEALARAQGQAPLPAECALTLPYVQAARNALDARSFAVAWAEGLRLSLEATCALALEADWQVGDDSTPEQLALAGGWRATSNLLPQPTASSHLVNAGRGVEEDLFMGLR
jgi:hypothetical protein